MSGRTALEPVARYLDGYLRVGEVPDEPGAVNGLQVENSGMIGGFIAAVDASQATIDGAIEARSRFGAPPLVLVHHGLFWDGNVPLTGRRYRRISALVRADVPLYSAHIPLDAHGEVGNNAVLAAGLGLTATAPFDTYRGIPLGIQGLAPDGWHRDTLVAKVDSLLGTTSRLIAGGPSVVRRIGVITGAAGSRIAAARDAGLDTFITGEGAHHTYFDAMEFGVNVIYAGHYATEHFGVKALAAHLGARFDLPWEFHDHPTGL